MRAAQIADLSGSYGTIQHQQIWDKVVKYGITRLYVTSMVNRNGVFVTDTAALNPDTRKYVLSKGVEFGIIRDPVWKDALDAVGLANDLEADLRAVGIPKTGTTGAGAPCAVMADAEHHDFNLAQFLTTWRALRPARETGWTIEGFQGGRIDATSVLNDPNLIVYPQAYSGAMYPFAQDAVWRDMNARLPASRVKLVYDGKLGAPTQMDGLVFTLERLPL